MASNVKIRDVVYNDVPSVDVLKADGSGAVLFYDTADATATADKMLANASAYGPSGKIDGNIATKTAADIAISGKTATLPTGYYKNVTKAVASGTANASENDVMNGKTFFDDNLTLKTGKLVVPVISQDGTTKVLSIR